MTIYLVDQLISLVEVTLHRIVCLVDSAAQDVACGDWSDARLIVGDSPRGGALVWREDAIERAILDRNADRKAPRRDHRGLKVPLILQYRRVAQHTAGAADGPVGNAHLRPVLAAETDRCEWDGLLLLLHGPATPRGHVGWRAAAVEASGEGRAVLMERWRKGGR
eukprot:scaffold155295_cov40-Tisochrysis_lutea.AAC.1